MDESWEGRVAHPHRDPTPILGSGRNLAGGETIAAPLQKSRVFPPMVISMIAVGEQTGGLDEMLSKMDWYVDGIQA